MGLGCKLWGRVGLGRKLSKWVGRIGARVENVGLGCKLCGRVGLGQKLRKWVGGIGAQVKRVDG